MHAALSLVWRLTVNQSARGMESDEGATPTGGDVLDSTHQPAVEQTAASTPPKKTRSNHTKPCAPPAGILDIPDAMLRKCHVLALCQVSDNTLHRRIKDGDFPSPDVHSGRNPLWRVQTIKDWLAGAVARELQGRHMEMSRCITAEMDSRRRAELLRQDRHLLEQIRRVSRSKNPPSVA